MNRYCKAQPVRPNATPYHAAVRHGVIDHHYAANTSATATEDAARFTRRDVRNLRKRAPSIVQLYGEYTCMNCALRKKCASFCATRTAQCSGKVEPLPPVTDADVKRMYVK